MGIERGIHIRFDRFLLPTSVNRQALDLTPGSFDSTGGAPAGTYFFEPRYNPYDRVASFLLQPSGRMVSSVLHAVRLRVPNADDERGGIHTWDGKPLSEQVRFTFMTKDTVTDVQADHDDRWPTVSFCNDISTPMRMPSIRSVLASCSGVSCHGVPGGGAPPMMGLDLSSGEGIGSTAIGVVAHQTVPGPRVASAAVTPYLFGDSMARIERSNPGGSYLMYKLLINPRNYPSEDEAVQESWEPGLGRPTPPSAQEIERLREGFVRMQPMPMQGRLTADQMRALVAWIAQGAEVASCPP